MKRETTTTEKTHAAKEERYDGPVPRFVVYAMLYLVLSLIFIPALSMRGEATLLATISGEDQLPQYRRLNDTTTVTVYADSDLVWLAKEGNTLNLSCSNATSGGYTCTYTFPSNYQNAGTYALTIKQESGEPPTTTALYTVDGVAPRFSRGDVTQLGASLSATYEVSDTASPGSTSGCSGIANVRLVVNDNTVATATHDTSACNANGVLTGSAPGLSGETSVYLLAEDRLGNTGQSAVVNRFIDTVPPSIPSAFTMTRYGEEVTKASTETSADVRVDLHVMVHDDRLSSVTVDASSLTTNTALANAYKNLPATCNGSEGTHECVVPNLQLRPATGELEIKVTARDASGNAASGKAYDHIELQNANPTVTYLGRGEQRCEETCYLKKGENDVLALINAPGGMNGKGVFFTLDDEMFSARNCTMVGGETWECTAMVMVTNPASGREVTLSIADGSMDDLGNKMVGTLERTMTLDNQAPRLLTKPKTDTACPTAGQPLHVTLKARDEHSNRLFLSAEVESVTDQERVYTECARTEENTFFCDLEINSFVSTHTEGNVPLYLTDMAGNTVDMTLKVEVCEADVDTTPNYIKELKVSGVPPVVDKRLASLIPFRVVIPLKLGLVGGARPVQVRRVTCDNAFTPGPSYVMNEFSTKPLLVTHYEYQGVWPNETVPLNCTIDFTMRRGNTVFVKPESESLNVELGVTRTELSNPGEAIREKEQALIKDITKLQSKIGGKARIDKSVGTFCRTAEMLGKINSLLQALKSTIYGICIVLVNMNFGGLAESLWKATDINLSGFHNFITRFIWPVGWFTGGGEGGGTSAAGAFKGGAKASYIGYLVKWICGLYTCKLYDADTYVGMAEEWMTYKNILGMGEGPGGADLVNDQGQQLQGGEYEALASVSIPGASSLSITLTLPGFGYESSTSILTPVSSSFTASGQSLYVDAIQGQQNNLEMWGNMVTDGELEGDGWIVNPYRSTNYDALCLPAQLYNLRKERQLKCIQLKCIQRMATSGLPTTQCDEQYSAQSCLYLESARARKYGSKDFLKQLGMAALISVGSAAIGKAYDALCGDLYTTHITPTSVPTGLKSVICGTTGAYFGIQELIAFKDNIANKNPTVPEGEDYCTGLESYEIEADDTT